MQLQNDSIQKTVKYIFFFFTNETGLRNSLVLEIDLKSSPSISPTPLSDYRNAN